MVKLSLKLHQHTNSLKIGVLFILFTATLYNFIQVRNLAKLPTITASMAESIESQLASASLSIAQNTIENQRLADLIKVADNQYQQQANSQLAKLTESAQAAEQQFKVMNDKIAAHSSALKQLNETLNQLQSVKTQLNKPPPAALSAVIQKKTTAASNVTKPQPPFVLTAIELRGGDYVAVLAPTKFNRLEQLNHLVVGQQWGEWQLTHLSPKSATLQQGKHKIVLSLNSRGLSQ